MAPWCQTTAVRRAIFSSVFASHIHECRLITVRAAMASITQILTFINMYATINKQTSAKENNYLITQRIKISCKHKKVSMPSLRTPMIQMQKVYYMKYCKIARNGQRMLRSNTTLGLLHDVITVKTKLNIAKKETGKIDSLEQVHTLLVNDEKLKDPRL